MNSPTIKPHVLPGETGGDSSWFSRQNEFEKQEILRQVAFKRQNWPDLGDGRLSAHPDHTYPHILPTGNQRLAFYEPLAGTILSYFMEEDIALHSEVLNLKSSQVACLNFLFPLRQDLALATNVMQAYLQTLQEVTEIEFEYTGPPEVTGLLGEPRSGKRGQNRTSIDAAIFWNEQSNRKHITLVEWKYTERNFGACSAFQSASMEEQAQCQSLNVAANKNPERSCLLTTGKRHRSRRYWDYMQAAGISLAGFADVTGCPFQGQFYQLMRQFLFAACLRKLFYPVRVDIVTIGFDGNKALHTTSPQLRPLAIGKEIEVIEAWNSVLGGVSPLRYFTVKELMSQFDQAPGVDQAWRRYINQRYGV